MSEFKREARYIVVKPDCEDSLRTERLKSYIDEMCFKTPDCVVVEADWPEYEPVWRMIESRVMGLPNELEYAQSELAALREELEPKTVKELLEHEHVKALSAKQINDVLSGLHEKNKELQQRLADAERRNATLITALTYLRDASDDSHVFEKAQDAINESNCSSCGGSKQERVLGRDNSELVIDCSICTQPTESGASE